MPIGRPLVDSQPERATGSILGVATPPPTHDTDPRLRPHQQRTYRFLREAGRGCCWDEAGTGKTRPLILAAEGRRLVIAPAAIRDTQVWEREADRLEVEPPRVISYQEAGRKGFLDGYRLDTLIIDEAHRLKEQKTSWFDPIYELAQRTERVYQGTGTPTPNDPKELWGQLRLVRPADERGMKYKWPWYNEWFDPAPTKYNAYEMGSYLKNCPHRDEHDDQSEVCEHWQAFYEANIAGYAIRHLRDDVLPDLPPLEGHDTPEFTPMKPRQLKAYRDLKKQMLAFIPEESMTLEAFTSAEQFVQLQMLSSGLSCLDPDADPKDYHSGKLEYLREKLAFADRPMVVVAWFRNSAAAIARTCRSLGINHETFGTHTGQSARMRIVQRFERGEIPVLIASLGVIKEGVDGLQYGSDQIVMFERYWVPGDNEQVVRRLHRFGQARPVTCRQLVTPDSVDRAQWEMLAKKRRNIRRPLSPLEMESILAA